MRGERGLELVNLFFIYIFFSGSKEVYGAQRLVFRLQFRRMRFIWGVTSVVSGTRLSLLLVTL